MPIAYLRINRMSEMRSEEEFEEYAKSVLTDEEDREWVIGQKRGRSFVICFTRVARL
ncbi:MAG: hypothetical protein ABSF44_14885 [Candidatus Bathyarchaeia archaeon]